MLLLSLSLVVGALALYVLVPSILLYWIYPWPVYALFGAAVGAAVISKRRGALRYTTIGVTAFLAALFVVYTLVLSQLHPSQLAVHVGEAFPEFTLPTSTHETFSPSQLKGQSAALYIFYRGHW